MAKALYFLTTHTLVVTLEDRNDVAVVGASVDARVQRRVDGVLVDVAGQSWPLSLVDQLDGTYEGTLLHSLTITRGESLVAIIDSTKGSAFAHAEPTLKVVVDGK